MGEALAVGLLDGGWEAEELAVAEVDADRHHLLEARLPGVRVVRNPAWAAGDAEVLVLAVKPADAVDALASCAEVLPDGALVLSIAAGVTIASLEAVAPGRPVVRAMPNTGALVGRGAAAIAPGQHVTELDLEVCERILGSVGVVVRVPEGQLDAVTGLSGSGPAYVFLVAEAMIEAGVLVGLPARHERATGAPDHPRCGHVARRRRGVARVVARRGHVAGRHHRRRPRGAGGPRGARRVPRGDRRGHPPLRGVGAGVSRKPRSERLPPKLPDPANERPARVDTGPNPRELLKQQHVAGRSLRYGRDEVLGIMRRVEHGAPSALCGLPAFPGLTPRTGRGRGRGRVRLGRRRPPRPHRAGVDRRRASPRRVTRVLEVARGGGRLAFATARPAALLQLYRRLAVRAAAEGGEVLAGQETVGFGPSGRRVRWIDHVAVLTDGAALLADDTVDAAEEWLFTLARPDLVVADHSYAGVASASGLEVVAFADLDAVALAVAAWQGRALRIVPLDDRRPPTAYAGLLDLLESLASAPSTPSARTSGRACGRRNRLVAALLQHGPQRPTLTPRRSGGYGRGERWRSHSPRRDS